MNSPSKILVDADILLMRAGYANEESVTRIVQGEEVKTRQVGSLAEATADIDSYLAKINREFPDSEFFLFISGTDNFRKRVDPQYKANRNAMDKPLLYDDLLEYLMTFGAYQIPYIEADDAMSICQYRSIDKYGDDSDTVICSIDKDLNQVPGHHYDFMKEVSYWVTPEEGAYNRCMQAICGDSTDNIKGVPGLGPKRSAKLLDPVFPDIEAMEQVVWEAFLNKFEEEGYEYCGVTKCLVNMLCDCDNIPKLTDEECAEVSANMKPVMERL